MDNTLEKYRPEERSSIVMNNINLELNRYKESVSQGASPKVLLDEKNDFLIELLGLSKEAYAEISSLEVDLFDSKLLELLKALYHDLHLHNKEF